MSREKIVNNEISKLVACCFEYSYKYFSDVIPESYRNKILSSNGGKIIDIMLDIPEENVAQVLYDSIDVAYEEYIRNLYNDMNQFAVYRIQESINNLKCDLFLLFTKKRYTKFLCNAFMVEYNHKKLENNIRSIVNDKLSFLG